MTKILNKNEIKAAPRAKPVPVEVPEWGGTVYVRPLMAWELDELELELAGGDTGQRDASNFRARLLAKCLCDEFGARLFADDEAGEIGEMDAAPISRLFEVAQTLAGKGTAKAIEKN